ncbi:MAG: HNH endonuclease [Oscillospiraceae bacterium]|nr:HNH endonuclease [Oscillospiraceae bacterium]
MREFDEKMNQSDADKAADYARSFGLNKAADYISRHYDGGEFVPGDPIPITTRNMSLEGSKAENGVPFERRTAELADGLTVEGVFPEFDSIHHVELGDAANDMSIHEQFSACREDFQDHMYDTPEKLHDITFGQMERLEKPQGYTPEGYTWQHNPETGSFDLVSQDEHSVGHTGGNALWGT